MEFCWNARILDTQTSIQQTESNIQVQNASLLQSVENILCFLEKYSVIICRQHKTAVQNLSVHLQKHHTISSKLRREIIESYRDKHVKSPHEIELPGPLGQPIQELGTPLDGFRCVEDTCDYITVNEDKLRVHVKKLHQQN